MGDVLEVSYTGDLLAHRRCPRAWAYEKYAQFHPHELVQAMEGRLIHHAMEWMTDRRRQTGQHAKYEELRQQLEFQWRVLWSRGIRTAFQRKEETLDRVTLNLFPGGQMHATVRAAIEGAVHTEYELKSVRKVLRHEFRGKSRMLLTGILDLVTQQSDGWVHPQHWRWEDEGLLQGEICSESVRVSRGDVEIWDYKGTRAGTPYVRDYVLQLLTYAGLYRERKGSLPERCVLFFVNEQQSDKQLVAVPVTQELATRAQEWTIEEARKLRDTMLAFEAAPLEVEGGELDMQGLPVGQRVGEELKKQCTACSRRFDCAEYTTHLGRENHPDVHLVNVRKN